MKVKLTSKNPFAGDGSAARRQRNQSPSVVSLQGCKLISCSPGSRIRSGEGIVKTDGIIKEKEIYLQRRQQ